MSQPCPFAAYERGPAAAARQPCTMCLPGQCVANECPGCGAQLGKRHDDECRSAGEQRRAYYGQFLPAVSA